MTQIIAFSNGGEINPEKVKNAVYSKSPKIKFCIEKPIIFSY